MGSSKWPIHFACTKLTCRLDHVWSLLRIHSDLFMEELHENEHSSQFVCRVSTHLSISHSFTSCFPMHLSMTFQTTKYPFVYKWVCCARATEHFNSTNLKFWYVLGSLLQDMDILKAPHGQVRSLLPAAINRNSGHVWPFLSYTLLSSPLVSPCLTRVPLHLSTTVLSNISSL